MVFKYFKGETECPYAKYQKETAMKRFFWLQEEVASRNPDRCVKMFEEHGGEVPQFLAEKGMGKDEAALIAFMYAVYSRFNPYESFEWFANQYLAD